MSSLFDLTDPKELHRPSDSPTSVAAAKEMVRSGAAGHMCHVALKHLLARPGSTAAELEEYSGLTDGKIRKRLNDLRKQGLAVTGMPRRCAVTGKTAQTWKPTEKGKQCPIEGGST